MNRTQAPVSALSEQLIEGLRDQHARDSAELRRLCAERGELRAKVTRLEQDKVFLQKRLTAAYESDDELYEIRVKYEDALLALSRYVQTTAHHNAPEAAAARAALRATGAWP